MDAWLNDLKSGFRALRARPGFSLAAVLTLGVTIGANTAIFSVVQAVLLRQMPFREPDRLTVLWTLRKDGGKDPLSIPDFRALRTTAQTFERMTAYVFSGANLSGDGGPERVTTARISEDFLEVMGVQPALGRPFHDSEAKEGAHVTLLGDALWRRRFGADPSVVGRDVVIDEESFRVVGVLPQGFLFSTGRTVDLAVPFAVERDGRASNRDANFLRAMGRLRPGVTVAQAAAELSGLARALDEKFSPVSHRAGMHVVPIADELVGKYRALLGLLLAAVGAVLLIGCANLVSLMLALGAARRREHAIRAALGAGRRRLIGQALAESMLLAVAGGALGVGLAAGGTSLLVSLSPAQIPRMNETRIDAVVLGFAALVALLCGVLSGLLPALEAARSDPVEGLGDGRTSPPPRSLRARRTLVAGEVALSLALLAVSGLLLRSFLRISEVKPGFDGSHALTLRISLPPRRYPDSSAVDRFARELQQRIAQVPAAEEAGLVNALPFSGVLSTTDFTVDGEPPPRAGETPEVEYRMISDGYFRALGIPLREGRVLDAGDTGSGRHVVVVNRRLAERFFPGGSAVGHRLRIDEGPPAPSLVEIVGVVEDVTQNSLEGARTFDLYVSLAQVPAAFAPYARNLFLAVRTRGDPMATARPILAALSAQDPQVAASGVQSLEQALLTSMAPRRFNVLLVEIFGAAALLLAGLGVYALTAFAVAQRRRELGIRLALGARPAALVRLTVAQAMQPVAAGLAVGLAAALIAGRLAAGLLFQISAGDPLSLIAAAGIISAAAVLAAFVPARRASRVDPQIALRAE